MIILISGIYKTSITCKKMGLIQNLVKGMKENKSDFKEKLKQAQMEDKVQTTLEERKKSSNQRELERYMN